jgi:mono/diheme cytochrome c family protein
VVIRLPKLQPHPIHHIGTRIIAGILAIGCILAIGYFSETPDAYTADVLSQTGDPTLGHAIFQSNCAGCHGLDAHGKVGPSLYQVSRRKSPARLIYQVISGSTPPMPQFKPNSQEMADLLSYLETL